MPRPRALMTVGAVVCVLVAPSGCAEPETTAEPVGPQVTTVLVDVPDATPEQLNAAAEIVLDRIQALDLRVGEVGWDDAAIEVTVSAADEQLVRAALAPAGVVEFRPVLAEMGATATGTTPTAQRSAEVQVTASDLDGGTYVLGPAMLSDAAVESAAAVESPSGTWTVDPVLREGPDGIDAFNSLAAACHAGAPTCPATSPDGGGMLAVVIDGVVLMAPVINAPNFERDQIQLAGDGDETSARALAAVLDGGVAEPAWTVRD